MLHTKKIPTALYTITPLTKQQRFDGAIAVLKQFYDNLTAQPHSVGYNVANKTTNNYNTFINNIERDGVITVSSEGSNFTIYDSIHYNTLARYHHDLIHLNYRLDFTPENETITAQIQMRDIQQFMDDNGTSQQTQHDVIELIYYDIIGQVKYYDLFKCFVINQKKFVYDLFLNGGEIKKEVFADYAYLDGITTGYSGVYLNGELIHGKHDKRDTNINIKKGA